MVRIKNPFYISAVIRSDYPAKDLLTVDRLTRTLEFETLVGFIFSRSGFSREAEDYCREKGIACSEDERWLESGKLK